MHAAKSSSPAITELASAIFDCGRRGPPKMGCDCEQCFGYCMVDKDEAMRARMAKFEASDLDDFPLEHLTGSATA